MLGVDPVLRDWVVPSLVRDHGRPDCVLESLREAMNAGLKDGGDDVLREVVEVHLLVPLVTLRRGVCTGDLTTQEGDRCIEFRRELREAAGEPGQCRARHEAQGPGVPARAAGGRAAPAARAG